MFHHNASASHTIYRAATHINTTSQHHGTSSTFRSFDNDGVAGGVIIAIVIILVVVLFRGN